jgi:hypothetical protein
MIQENEGSGASAADATEYRRKAFNLRAAAGAARDDDHAMRELFLPKVAITCERTADWLEAIAAGIDAAAPSNLHEALKRIAEMTDIEADFDGFEARTIARKALGKAA